MSSPFAEPASGTQNSKNRTKVAEEVVNPQSKPGPQKTPKRPPKGFQRPCWLKGVVVMPIATVTGTNTAHGEPPTGALLHGNWVEGLRGVEGGDNAPKQANAARYPGPVDHHGRSRGNVHSLSSVRVRVGRGWDEGGTRVSTVQ